MDGVHKLKQIIVATCEQPAAFEQLCKRLGMSYEAARKAFRRMEGVTMQEYRQQCRQQKAEAWLSDPESRIFEVAYQLGFRHEANFTRWFKKRTGRSPSAFKEEVLGK